MNIYKNIYFELTFLIHLVGLENEYIYLPHQWVKQPQKKPLCKRKQEACQRK